MKLISSFLFLSLNLCSLFSFSMTPGNITVPVTINSISKHTAVPSVLIHTYKSFREWKAAMIASSVEKLNQSQQALNQKRRLSALATDPNSIYKSKPEAGLSSQLEELQQQAEKDQYQLSIAKDLTISDYFVGYLTLQKDLSATITEVSSRLSAEEIAELMHAYANNFFSSKPSSQSSAPKADSNQ